jgi:hypothetical protein
VSDSQSHILDLAFSTRDNPECFIRSLKIEYEHLSDAQKGSKFLEIGMLVFDNSFFEHCLASCFAGYRYYITAVALQKAMIKTMKSGIVGGHDWSHPYFWAPFVLVGDWE